jgi:hypothetical protein
MPTAVSTPVAPSSRRWRRTQPAQVRRVTTKVQALLQERQDRRKAELDAHRRDMRRFTVGDEVLLDTEYGAGALGGPRRIWRHVTVGAARAADQL